MTWIIQNNMPGPLQINDLGLNMISKQTFDLDVIGRVQAERSNELKVALQKQWVISLKKTADPVSPSNNMTHEAAAAISAAAEKFSGQAAKVEEQTASLRNELKQTQTQLTEARQELAENKATTDSILKGQELIKAQVQAFADSQPLLIRTIKETLENITVERGAIAEKREAIKESGMDADEMKANERILALKDKTLEKNYNKLGKTVSKDADNVNDIMDAMDDVGI